MTHVNYIKIVKVGGEHEKVKGDWLTGNIEPDRCNPS